MAELRIANQHKPCKGCGVNKPLEAYSRQKLGKFGRRSRCKTCIAVEAVPYRAATAEHRSAYNATYRSEHLPEAKKRSREWNKNNRDKMNKATREWRQRNPEKVKAQKKSWNDRNPDRVTQHKRDDYLRNKQAYTDRATRWRQQYPERKLISENRRRALLAGAAGSGYTTIEKIMARVNLYGGRCVYCGKDWESIDHRIPIAKGGSHWPANLVPACRSCNSRKRTRSEKKFKEVMLRHG